MTKDLMTTNEVRDITLKVGELIDKDSVYMQIATRGHADPNIKMYDIFKTGVFDGDYLSEDFYVCKVLRDLGFTVYVDPNVRTIHNGMM